MSKQLLSNKLFHEKILRLEAAFRINRLSQGALDVYYEKLCGFNDKDFASAVEVMIDAEDFFPSISKFLKLKMHSTPVILTDETLKKLNE
jgi:hypothetical protein